MRDGGQITRRGSFGSSSHQAGGIFTGNETRTGTTNLETATASPAAANGLAPNITTTSRNAPCAGASAVLSVGVVAQRASASGGRVGDPSGWRTPRRSNGQKKPPRSAGGVPTSFKVVWSHAWGNSSPVAPWWWRLLGRLRSSDSHVVCRMWFGSCGEQEEAYAEETPSRNTSGRSLSTCASHGCSRLVLWGALGASRRHFFSRSSSQSSNRKPKPSPVE